MNSNFEAQADAPETEVKTKEASETDEDPSKPTTFATKKLKDVVAQLTEEMAHLTKIQNRHERDLVKLKPVTLQAPDAANKETDLISCLTDIMSERMMRQQKQLFVTRNEFQSLSDLLPDTTAHFVCELEGLTK